MQPSDLGRGQAEKNAQKLSVEIVRSNLYVRKSSVQ